MLPVCGKSKLGVLFMLHQWRVVALSCRLQRLQGILKAVRSTAANAEDMVKAQTAVVKLQAQLTDLQRAESELNQQVSGSVPSSQPPVTCVASPSPNNFANQCHMTVSLPFAPSFPVQLLAMADQSCINN